MRKHPAGLAAARARSSETAVRGFTIPRTAFEAFVRFRAFTAADQHSARKLQKS